MLYMKQTILDYNSYSHICYITVERATEKILGISKYAFAFMFVHFCTGEAVNDVNNFILQFDIKLYRNIIDFNIDIKSLYNNTVIL